MKNVNIKKVVAGAAALAIAAGSLGAVVSAANVADSSYTTPNGLARADMFNAQGAPSYNIVVGSTGHASDVVWAANIAAAIGKKAYNVSTASATGGDVVVEVGAEGITTTSVSQGSGDIKDNIPITINSLNSFNLPLENFEYGKLYDGDIDGKLKNDNSYTNKIRESLTLNGNTNFSTTKNVKDFIALIESSNGTNKGIVYKVTFDTPLRHASSDTVAYFGAGSTLEMYFMGEKYDVQEVTRDKMVLVGSGSKQVYNTGDIINVPGVDGESYTLTIGNAYSMSGGDLKIQIRLEKNGSTLSTKTFELNEKVEFSGYNLSKSISVVDILDDTSNANNDLVELSMGTGSLLELENGEALPGYKSGNKDLWFVDFDSDASVINSISVYNKDLRWHRDDFTSQESGLAIGDKIELPLGLGVVEFLGLTTEKMYTLEIGDNEVKWQDDKGRMRSAFMYEDNLDKSTKNIDGRDYYFKLDGTTLKIYRGTSDVGTSTDIANADGEVIGLEGSSNEEIFYKVIVDEGNLILSLSAIDDNDDPISYEVGKSTGKSWSVYGTFDKNDKFTDWDLAADDNDEVLATPTIGAFVDGSAVSSSDWYTLFVVNTATENTYVFVDPSTLDIARRNDYASGTTYYENYRRVTYGYDLVIDALDTDATNANLFAFNKGDWYLDTFDNDDLTKAYTTFGSFVELNGSRVRFEIPETTRELAMFMGGEMTSSTTSLGSEVTLTTPGEVVDADGIKVKLVSAPQGSATTYTPAAFGNIAYLDTDTLPAGNKIIVGGWMVNEEAKNLGLQDLVTKAGDFVAGKNAQGNIVVAGFHKEDTANAAKELIAAIEAMN